MKFKHKRPKQSERRTVTKFLLFPKTINDETRWMEEASWIEQCVYYLDRHGEDAGWEWKPEKWIDESSNGA